MLLAHGRYSRDGTAVAVKGLHTVDLQTANIARHVEPEPLQRLRIA